MGAAAGAVQERGQAAGHAAGEGRAGAAGCARQEDHHGEDGGGARAAGDNQRPLAAAHGQLARGLAAQGASEATAGQQAAGAAAQGEAGPPEGPRQPAEGEGEGQRCAVLLLPLPRSGAGGGCRCCCCGCVGRGPGLLPATCRRGGGCHRDPSRGHACVPTTAKTQTEIDRTTNRIKENEREIASLHKLTLELKRKLLLEVVELEQRVDTCVSQVPFACDRSRSTHPR